MLRIVHFSDILAGSNEAVNVSAALAATSLGEHQPPFGQRVDYIVVAGNITVDGSKRSYEEARRLLSRYAEALLRRDIDGLRLNRMLIVPGQRDIHDERSAAAFRDFHDTFFEKEIAAGRVEPFDLQSVIIRELKDLSLVGLSCWVAAPNASVVTDFDDVNIALRAASQSSRMMSIEYTKRPPTLVVSAANIAASSTAAAAEIFKSIQTRLKSDFRTTLHFFGRGGTLAYPSPVGFSHPGFGTGEPTAGAWPFHANVIELSSRGGDPAAAGGPFLSSAIFLQQSPEAAPALLPWISGELDGIMKIRQEPPRPRREGIFDELLRTLEEKFEPGSHKYVVLRGFPGAGRSTFFEFMKNRDQLIRKKVHVIAMQLRSYAGFAEEFAQKAQAFRDLGRPDLMPILVVHDLCLATLRPNQFEALKNLFDENDPCTLMKELGGVVLLLPAIDITLGAARDSHTDTISLKPSGRATELIEEFADRLPVEESRLLNLTDGYTGFTELILRTASNRFSDFSGAEPVTRAKISTLLDQAFEEPSVQAEAFYHRQSYAVRNTGPELCQYIIAKVNDAIDAAREQRDGDRNAADAERQCDPECAAVSDIPPVYINVDELRVLSRTPDQVMDDLKAFHDLGVLGRMADGRTFRVRVVAPFLPQQARRAALSWPTVGDDELAGPADVLILTALPEEREAVLAKLPNARKLESSEDDIRTYYLAKLPVSGSGTRKPFYRVVVTDLVGMAQTHAALAASDALRRWKPRALLLVGIAGGVEASGVALGDVLIASDIAYFGISKVTDEGVIYEQKMIPTDPRLLTAMNNFARDDGAALITVRRPESGVAKVHVGPMATSDTVVASEALLKRYQSTTRKLIGVEMEAWGAAMAAFQMAHPKRFFMIRAASDLADFKKDRAEVQRWRDYACDVAASYAIGFLRSGPLPLASPAPARTQGVLSGGADAIF